jgi:internalin A
MKRWISAVLTMIMTISLLVGNGLASPMIAKAEEIQTVVGIEIPQEVNVGKAYDVKVMVDNVSDLYSYSFDFVYNPQLVQVVDVIGGDILGTQAKELTNIYDNELGSVSYSSTLTTMVPGISGAGSLVTLRVKLLSEGTIPFNVNQNSGDDLTLIGDTVKVLMTNGDGQAIGYAPVNVSSNIVMDTKPAAIASVNVENKSEVIINPEIVVTYDEPVFCGTNFNNITLLDFNNKPLLVNAFIENNTLRITPRGSLENFSTYHLIVPAGAVRDESGNETVVEYRTSFTTEKAVEDINKDGYINIFDLVPVARNYNVLENQEGWNQQFDITADGKIDMFDLIAIVKRFVVHQAVRITGLQDMNVTVYQSNFYSLPSEVEAQMSDGSIRKVPVIWSPNSIDTSRLGRQMLEGTVKGYLSKIRLTVDVVAQANGNTNGNLVNGGYYLQQGDWVYYADYINGFQMFKRSLDGTQRSRVTTDDHIRSINILGEWIYYMGYMGVYKVKTDGNGLTWLAPGSGQVIVYDNYIYYNDWEEMYRMDLDGGNRKLLGRFDIQNGSSLWQHQFNIADGFIYFTNGVNIYKVSLDGTSSTHLYGGAISYINVVGDWIYYLDGNRENAIYKMKTDGTEQGTLVCSDSGRNMNIEGGYIYYSNLNDNSTLYRMNLDGTGKKKLSTMPVYDYINISGEWIYFDSHIYETEDLVDYKVRLDGTEEQTTAPIRNIEPVIYTIPRGSGIGFNGLVTATFDHERSQDIPVVWSKPEPFDIDTPGTYVFEGSVLGYAGKARMEIIVLADEIVSFADPDLENAVRSNLGIWEGPICKSQVETIEFLGIYDTVINNLSGIENLTNLSYLQIYHSGALDLSPLAGLNNLRELYLQNAVLSDLSPLARLTNLRALDLENSTISDFSALVGLYNLEYLNLRNTNTEDVSPIGGFSQLKLLILSENNIMDISALSELTNLEELNLNNNQISDLSPITGLINLTTLHVGNNPIVDLGSLSGLANLSSLYVHNTPLYDISALREFPNLQSLDISYTEISDLSPLNDITNLSYLNLSGNGLTDISFLGSFVNLRGLTLSNNQISDLTALRNLTNMISLTISNNQVSDISPLRGMTKMRTLNLVGNQISDLEPLSGMVNLLELDLSQNQINNISPLSTLTEMYSLSMSENYITDLSGISNLVWLEYLNIAANEITDITPLQSLNVNVLYMQDNWVSDMSPIAGMHSLGALYIQNNPVGDFSVLGPIYNQLWSCDFDLDGNFGEFGNNSWRMH